jgi:hypothetical protein
MWKFEKYHHYGTIIWSTGVYTARLARRMLLLERYKVVLKLQSGPQISSAFTLCELKYFIDMWPNIGPKLFLYRWNKIDWNGLDI